MSMSANKLGPHVLLAPWNGLWLKQQKVKTATGQNGNTKTATGMAIVKTSTNPNNTYSSSDAYIIDRRLYTYIWNATVELYEKVQYFISRNA